MQIVPLADLKESEPTTMTVQLLKNMDPNDEANTKKFRGDLTFEMTYKPFKNVSCFVNCNVSHICHVSIVGPKTLIKSEPVQLLPLLLKIL